MIIAEMYECVGIPDCGVRLLRPGLLADDRDPPTCSCGLKMRAAGHLVW